jgi:hypothetical protein
MESGDSPLATGQWGRSGVRSMSTFMECRVLLVVKTIGDIGKKVGMAV